MPIDTTGTQSSTAFNAGLEVIAAVDPRIAAAIRDELHDQRDSLKLIASENYASPATLLTMGNWLSDKYAEGSVGHRFYAGCQNVDTVESLAVEYAKQLFGAEHAYVQPHSGIDANLVAFWAILSKRVEAPRLVELNLKQVNQLDDAAWAQLRADLGNQRLLGMDLAAGGHLTHGFRPNISGKMFEQRSYGVDPVTGLVDYDEVARIAREFRPLIIVAGYSAYPRRLDFARFRAIANEVGATLMVDMAHFAGLVAGKVFTGVHNPVPYADIVTSTTHKSLRGPRGGLILCTEAYAEFVERGCPLVLGGPLPNVIAAKAVAFAEALKPAFRTYATQIATNAAALAAGLLAHGSSLTTGGTANHLLVLDVTPYGLTGRQAEAALLEVGIVTNRNTVPNDVHGPWYTSGIRLGTPALTTRGFDATDMIVVADLIHATLTATSAETNSKAHYTLDPAARTQIAGKVAELLRQHPLYAEINLG